MALAPQPGRIRQQEIPAGVPCDLAQRGVIGFKSLCNRMVIFLTRKRVCGGITYLKHEEAMGDIWGAAMPSKRRCRVRLSEATVRQCQDLSGLGPTVITNV